MLPGPTPSSIGRRGKGLAARRLHLSCIYLGCAAFLTLAALFYGADAFFWVLRHSRAIRGSCLPRPSANPLYSSLHSLPSFAVLSFHHQENSDLRALTLKNHERYCRRHGYTYIDGYDWYINRSSRQREKTWDKILFIRHAMSRKETSDADWLFWIDPDAVFANEDIELHELLRGLDAASGQRVLLAAAPDALCINTGVLLLRNDAAGADFVDEWLATRNVTIDDDQRGLNVLYNRKAREAGLKCSPGLFPYGTHAELSCHETPIPEVSVLSPCAMNAGPGLEWKPGSGPYWPGVFMHGDFIMHVAGHGKKKAGLLRKQLQGEHFWSKRRSR